ncbi:hypothetical protein [Oscillatoria sp. FACHB-1406]|uniref:hypothetical protein n=1 Tax=Oscillatoria sp. FACHB-1406 TaxID=2692846 RepID=UPI001683BFE2|nr:hypothetical protein [Oscillatoria sp. FACHB-1406]MBD2580053.1 hypothetical protein [Oscillatoria sp. FACHB-1406]
MSSLEQRLTVFRQLSLRAQFIFIATSRDNAVLAKDPDYIPQLEAVHQECLKAASPEERKAYSLTTGQKTDES